MGECPPPPVPRVLAGRESGLQVLVNAAALAVGRQRGLSRWALFESPPVAVESESAGPRPATFTRRTAHGGRLRLGYGGPIAAAAAASLK